MGRTKPRTRSTRLIPSTAPPEPLTSTSPSVKAKRKQQQQQAEPSVPALLEKAQALLVQGELDLAKRFVERVLEKEEGSVEGREMLGVVEMENGETDRAREIFLTLVPPSTTAPTPPPPSAHLYLAQLFSSSEEPRLALEHYHAAIALLTARLQKKGKERTEKTNEEIEEEEGEMRRTVVRACCSVVDIWMTDLCMEPEAESSCETILGQALDIDPNNTEALLSLTSVRMSQQRPEDAEACLRKVWAEWEEVPADSPLHPAPPLLLSLTRLALELRLYSLALTAIARTLEMDDQDVEAWYLEGWCFWLMAQDDEPKEGVEGEEAERMGKEEMLRDARDCLDTCLLLHTTLSHPDEELLQHVQELLGELDSLGVHPSPPEANGVDGDEGDEDDEWIDDEDEDEVADADGDVEMA